MPSSLTLRTFKARTLKQLYKIALLLMLFAQVEGAFDDIPQITNGIKRALSISHTYITKSKPIRYGYCWENNAVVETDDEDSSGLCLAEQYNFNHYKSEIIKSHVSCTLKAYSVDSGTRRDRSPPANPV